MRLCNLTLPLPDTKTTEVNAFLHNVGSIMNGAVRIFPKEITFKNSEQKRNYFLKNDQDVQNSNGYGLVSEIKFFQRVGIPSIYLICQQ
jgi:hypothetical protein